MGLKVGTPAKEIGKSAILVAPPPGTETRAQRQARELREKDEATIKRVFGQNAKITRKTAISDKQRRDETIRQLEKFGTAEAPGTSIVRKGNEVEFRKNGQTVVRLDRLKNAKIVKDVSGKLKYQQIRGRKVIETPVNIRERLSRGSNVIELPKKELPKQEIPKQEVSLITGDTGSRIQSGTFLESITRKEVKEVGPTIAKQEGIKQFEQRIPLKGTILVTKKGVNLTQKEMDIAQKFIDKNKAILFRAERLDNVLNKAEKIIEKNLNIISPVLAPALKGNNFLQQTGKKYISNAFLYFNPISLPLIIGARGANLAEQAIQTGKILMNKNLRRIMNKLEGDPQAFKNMVNSSATQAVKAVGQNFDPRTPEGLANILLTLTPLGIEGIAKIKTPLAKVVSSSAKVSKSGALKFINTTIKSLNKIKAIKGVKTFIKTAQYNKQLLKAKAGIRKAQKQLSKYTKEGKKVTKTTKKKLKQIEKEVLNKAQQKKIDDIILAEAKALAKKRLTPKEIIRITNINKIRKSIIIQINKILKKSDNLIKSRKNIKGKFIEKRILNNINKRAKLEKQISQIESKLLDIIKKKKSIFNKVKINKEQVALGKLENLRQSLRKDTLFKKDLKIKTEKVSKVKLKQKIQQNKTDIFIKRAIQDFENLKKIKAEISRQNRLINIKNINSKIKSNIIVNLEKFKLKTLKLRTEINKFKSFLKSKKTRVSNRNFRKIPNELNNFKRDINRIEMKILRLKPKPLLKAKFSPVSKRRLIKGKTKFTGAKIKIEKFKIINTKRIINRIKSNINFIKENINNKVSNQIGKVKQIINDEIKIFKDGAKAQKEIDKLFTEENRIKSAIKQRRTNLIRATKLKQKRAVIEGIKKEIDKYKKDFNFIDDLIELKRRDLDLGSKTIIDINKIISDLIQRGNSQRAKDFIDSIKKKSKEPIKEPIKQKIEGIISSRRIFNQIPFSNQELLTIIETENIAPVINRITPQFNIAPFISGVIGVVKPKIDIIKPKTRIRVIQSKVTKPKQIVIPRIAQGLIPKSKITPKINNIIKEIVVSESIIKIDNMIKQESKEIQEIIEKVAQRQKQKLKQKLEEKTKKPKILLIPILRLDGKIKLRSGERYTYNMRIKRAGKIQTIKIKSPKNKALKKLTETLDNSIARSGEIFIVGKTRNKDIKKVSLEGFRQKRSKDPRVLSLVEISKKALDTKRERQQLALSRRSKKKSKVKKKAKKRK